MAEPQTIDITTISLLELKALAFDKINVIEMTKQELAIIQKQMGEVMNNQKDGA